MATQPNILVAIIHHGDKYLEYCEKLKTTFAGFDMCIPTVDLYGRKWAEVKKRVLENGYDSVFLICSDVRVVCGDVVGKIRQHAADRTVGSYGFGTINNFTFGWLGYDNANLVKAVPFIEGYCFGVNRKVLERTHMKSTYGYGIEVEIGCRAQQMGLQCLVDSEVCISHAYGKSYSDTKASNEYRDFLVENPDVASFLNSRNIPHPMKVPPRL